ncbi:GNAT family N-acetyltransferase [Euzebya tangerina]|uniref:GNAT family N-acetyltransferase n=1 Tax=Euzebya tangerina TaxID=591198 RepID=UPI000E317235|nr:GNAT family N-acetyltransferase [Euzebya tangerina]
MPDALTRHLREWVGAWPPTQKVQVVGNPAREEPGWDGRVFPLVGVGDGINHVIGVSPSSAEAVRRVIGTDLTDPTLGERLSPILGRRGAVFGSAVFRWTHLVNPVPDVGVWMDPADLQMPAWLRPFNGRRLVARDVHGRYLAGVGIKVHDDHGQELSVVTSPAARGRGLATGLVATAARRVISDGSVPTYLHERSNIGSAKVAAAVGFPDRGWQVHGLWGG